MVQRLLMIGVLLLLGGAIVNIAVAWGCAAAQFAPSSQRNAEYEHWIGARRSISTREQADLAAVGLRPQTSMDECFEFVLEARSYRGFGWRQRTVIETERIQSDCRRNITKMSGLDRVARFADSGWPAQSLTGFEYLKDRSTWEITNLIEVSKWKDRTGQVILLPLRPTWPGFAINTIFYAAMLWVVFFVPGMVRRMIRRRRGRCPACAYPVGSSPVCTECGATISRGENG